MKRSEQADKICQKLFPMGTSEFAETDPEFTTFFENFAFGEVPAQGGLDDRTRSMVILAALIGSQGAEAFGKMLPAAFTFGVTPVEAKEIVYQAVAYLGIGRVYPFLSEINAVLASRGEVLPLEGQATTDESDRLEKGEQAQVDIFGDGMRGFSESGPAETRHINRWLSANCFGDYYTRKGLDDRRREMITFCFLAAQGGCEPQLTSHAMGNMRIGNDKAFLIAVVSQMLPYIGYPRSLNAISCINAAADKMAK